jgi:hypothetical protein
MLRTPALHAAERDERLTTSRFRRQPLANALLRFHLYVPAELFLHLALDRVGPKPRAEPHADALQPAHAGDSDGVRMSSTAET